VDVDNILGQVVILVVAAWAGWRFLGVTPWRFGFWLLLQPWCVREVVSWDLYGQPFATHFGVRGVRCIPFHILALYLVREQARRWVEALEANDPPRLWSGMTGDSDFRSRIDR